MNDERKKSLLETVDQDTQDLIEWRLHSHTESSMRIVAGFAAQLKKLTEIIERHDKILSGTTVESILKIVKKAQNDEIIALNNKRLGKAALWWIGALVSIGTLVAMIIEGVRWFSYNVMIR